MTVTLDRREQRITRLHLYFKDVRRSRVAMFGISTETVDFGAAFVREVAGMWG